MRNLAASATLALTATLPLRLRARFVMPDVAWLFVSSVLQETLLLGSAEA